MRVGLIVEGDKDVPVFEELIRKVEPSVTHVIVRPIREGKHRFLARFPAFLWDLGHVHAGGPVDKVIVVRDADQDDPADIEAEMRQRLERRRHPNFHKGIEFHATRRETETWLLADVDAISAVAARNRGRQVAAIPGPLENIANAKERFIGLLTAAGLPYVPEIVREITREADLATLRLQCPGFRLFEEKVKR